MQIEQILFPEMVYVIAGQQATKYLDETITSLLQQEQLKGLTFDEQDLTRGSSFLAALEKKGISYIPETVQGFLLTFIAKLASIKNKSIEDPKSDLYPEINELILQTQKNLIPYSTKARQKYLTKAELDVVEKEGDSNLIQLENINLKIFEDIAKKLLKFSFYVKKPPTTDILYHRNFSQHLELVASIITGLDQLTGNYKSLKRTDDNFISVASFKKETLNDGLAITLTWLEKNHPSKENFIENLVWLKKITDNNFILEWVYFSASSGDEKRYQNTRDLVHSLYYHPESKKLVQNIALRLKEYFDKTTENDNLHHEFHETIFAKFIRETFYIKNTFFFDFLIELNEYAKTQSAKPNYPNETFFCNGAYVAAKIKNLILQINENKSKDKNNLTISLIRIQKNCEEFPQENHFYDLQNFIKSYISYHPDNSLKPLLSKFLSLIINEIKRPTPEKKQEEKTKKNHHGTIPTIDIIPLPPQSDALTKRSYFDLNSFFATETFIEHEVPDILEKASLLQPIDEEKQKLSANENIIIINIFNKINELLQQENQTNLVATGNLEEILFSKEDETRAVNPELKALMTHIARILKSLQEKFKIDWPNYKSTDNNSPAPITTSTPPLPSESKSQEIPEIINLFPSDRRVFFEKSNSATVKRNITYFLLKLIHLNTHNMSNEEINAHKKIIKSAFKLLYQSYFSINARNLVFEDYENLFKIPSGVHKKIENDILIKALTSIKYKSISLKTEQQEIVSSINLVKFNSDSLIASLMKIKFPTHILIRKNQLIENIKKMNANNENILQINNLSTLFDQLLSETRSFEKTSLIQKKLALGTIRRIHQTIMGLIDKIYPFRNIMIDDILENFLALPLKYSQKKPSEKLSEIIPNLKAIKEETVEKNESIDRTVEIYLDEFIRNAAFYDNATDAEKPSIKHKISSEIIPLIRFKLVTILGYQKSNKLSLLEQGISQIFAMTFPKNISTYEELATAYRKDILNEIVLLNTKYPILCDTFIKSIQNNIDTLITITKEIEKNFDIVKAKNQLIEAENRIILLSTSIQKEKEFYAPLFQNHHTEIIQLLKEIKIELKKWKLSTQIEAYKNLIIDRLIVLNNSEIINSRYIDLLSPFMSDDSLLANYLKAFNAIIDNGEFLKEKLADLEIIYNQPRFIENLQNLDVKSELEAEHRMKILDLACGEKFKCNLDQNMNYVSLLKIPSALQTSNLGKFIEPFVNKENDPARSFRI